MKRLCATSWLFLLMFVSVRAHHPNEVSYFFKLDEKELVVHLTPKSAIDILEHLYPDLKEQNHFLLASYSADLETYFNEHTVLTINDQVVSLGMVETHLNVHDATIKFELSDIPIKPKNFTITATGLLDVYKKGKNHVFLFTNGSKRHYVLDSSKNKVEIRIQNIENQNSMNKFWVLAGSFFFMILSIGFAVYRKQSLPFKPFHSS